MTSICLRPALLFFSLTGVKTAASISARKLSNGTTRAIISSGSPFAVIAASRRSASKNPNCPIVPTPANLVVTNQTRTNSRRSLFFEDVVDHGLVLIRDVRNGGRQREHHMEVRHRQQIGLARREPFGGGGALALGTMPVAATVVGDDGVGAALATRHMPAERGGAAALDRTHHLHLVEADVPGIGTAPSGAV